MFKIVDAHCDGPCGHYETDTLKNSALTCLKLAKKLLDLTPSEAQYIRLIMLKEEHAQICKQQIYILWSDYFKAHHYQANPQLHNQLYIMAQQCSLIKQNADIKIVEDFINQIEALDKIFKEAT
ncbi:MAG: superoxide dismutase, Ni [Candidatus Saccharibacteria bacterium]|nr:superoxide dismutase, Ni [Candidatus Saccharibacteria bacterium]